LYELSELVMNQCAELGILLGKILHELGVAWRDLGAQLRIPAMKHFRFGSLNSGQ
jgi:hypothetical protein